MLGVDSKLPRDLEGIADARRAARLDASVRAAMARRIQALSAGRFSRRSLAAETGLGIGTVMNLWAGRTDPALSTMLALVDALGLRSIDELLGPLGTQTMLELQQQASADGTRSAWHDRARY
jgi:transcriptional regulator with XRE-family HTH domain